MKFTELLDKAAQPVALYRRRVFKTFLIAFCSGGCPGRVSGIFRKFAVFLAENTIVRKFYNFLDSSKLHWSARWEFLVGMIGIPDVAGRLLIALDDTLYGKTGKKISGCATHHDHAAKQNSTKWVFVHCRVLAGLLLFGHGRWACLPFVQKLYAPLSKSVKASSKLPHSEWLKTKSGIGAELVLRIISLFKRPDLIVCDSWFGCKPLLDEVRKNSAFPVELLTRLINARLFEFPRIISGKRGRPSKFGRRLTPVKELSAELRASSRTAKIHIYGKERTVEFSELLCMSKALAYQVKVVFVYYKGFAFPLICTDMTLTAEEMIEFYSARWKIESGFKEIKQNIGAIDSQCRNHLSVEKHFNLCCFAASITWIYAFNLEHAPERRHPSRHSGAFSFADVRRKISAELSDCSILPRRCPEHLIPAIKSICASIFRWAA